MSLQASIDRLQTSVDTLSDRVAALESGPRESVHNTGRRAQTAWAMSFLSKNEVHDLTNVCHEILRREGKPGTIKAGRDASVLDGTMRQTTLAWMRPYQPGPFTWLLQRVHTMMIGWGHVVNGMRQWGFDLDSVPQEPIQITSATEAGFYKMHRDDTGENTHPGRRLSLSLLLQPAKEGGELAFAGQISDELTGCINRAGTIVAFPSSEQHTVQQVTDGERLSLVLWMSGK